MKNNKGFSLVEMIVTIAVLAIVMTEISALMINSSKLYLNGTREVTLQKEAQLVIQQLEDLMVDANWGISHTYDDSISSDRVITISANQAEGLVYTIEYIPSTDASIPYGQLYFTQVGGTEPCNDILLADYVGSISLNMANFTSNDVVTLDLVMQNEQYSYEASQDIFCRNMIGSKRKNRGNAHNTVSEREIVLNRFTIMDLDAEFYSDIYNFEKENGTGYTYSYKWLDAVKNGRTPNDVYSLNSTYHTLQCKDYMNTESNYSKSYPTSVDPECIIICVAKQGLVETEVSKGKIITPAVGIGLGLGSTTDGITNTSKYGYGLVFPSGQNDSGYISAVKIDGIDPGYCESIDYSISLKYFEMPNAAMMSSLDTKTDSQVDSIINLISYDGYTANIVSANWVTGATSTSPGFQKIKLDNTNINWSDKLTKEGSMIRDVIGCDASALQLNGFGFESDSASNSILVHTGRMCNGAGNIQHYYAQIRKGYLLTGHFTFKFPGNKKLDYDLYFMPNADGTGMSEAYAKNSLKIFYKMLEKLPES